MLRTVLATLGLLLAMAAPALAAPVFATPQELLDYAYAPYATGDFKDDNQIIYSKALNAMFAAAEARTSEDDVGPVDFDVFVNGQDYELKDLKFGDPKPEGEGVTVPVTFKNFDEPESLVFHLVKEDGGWKIGDIESLTEGSEWRLTTLLTPDTDNSGTDNSGAGSDSGAADGAAAK